MEKQLSDPAQLCLSLFFSTWFPKCNIFQCFRNQTNQGHCSDVKPCPIFHKIPESCIKCSQRTHSFNEEPVMFPHKFIAWELSSAFCSCQNALAFYFLYGLDFKKCKFFHTQLSPSMDKIFSHLWHIYILKGGEPISLSVTKFCLCHFKVD